MVRSRQLWLSDLRNACAGGSAAASGCACSAAGPCCCCADAPVAYGASGEPLLLHVAFDDLVDAAALGDVVEVVGFATQRGGGAAGGGGAGAQHAIASVQVRRLVGRGRRLMRGMGSCCWPWALLSLPVTHPTPPPPHMRRWRSAA
jgi:hypothetical protein